MGVVVALGSIVYRASIRRSST